MAKNSNVRSISDADGNITQQHAGITPVDTGEPAVRATELAKAVVTSGEIATIAQQIARLMVASDKNIAAGFAGTDRDNQPAELGQLRSVRAKMALACRILTSIADGDARFPQGTGDQWAVAQARRMALENTDPGSADMDQRCFHEQVADHAHNNVAVPLRELAKALHETLMGEPIPAQPKAKAPTKKKVELDF